MSRNNETPNHRPDLAQAAQDVAANKEVLDRATAQLDITQDLINAIEVPDLRENLNAMFLAAMNSPETEDQQVRADIGFTYRLISAFLTQIEPYSMFYGKS